MKSSRFAVFVLLLFSLNARANENGVINGVGLENRIGSVLPLDSEAIDENGLTVKLVDLLDGKPALLNFSVFRCTNLCGLVTSGIADAVRNAGLRPGRDVRLLTISLDPGDTPALALMKKRTALARLGLSGDWHPAWHFLMAKPEVVNTLALASGVRFRDVNQHPAAVLVVSPNGKLSRTFSGISFDAEKIKQAVTDAGRGLTRTSFSDVILNCLPSRAFNNKYGLLITGALQWLGLLTLVGLASLIFGLTRRARAAR